MTGPSLQTLKTAGNQILSFLFCDIVWDVLCAFLLKFKLGIRTEKVTEISSTVRWPSTVCCVPLWAAWLLCIWGEVLVKGIPEAKAPLLVWRGMEVSHSSGGGRGALDWWPLTGLSTWKLPGFTPVLPVGQSFSLLPSLTFAGKITSVFASPAAQWNYTGDFKIRRLTPPLRPVN